MAEVEITINGQPFLITCKDGQEKRLQDLSVIIDAHVQDLVEQVGQIGHNRLLVMAALLITDELVDLRDVADEVAGERADERAAGADDHMADAIEGLAARIESIAGKLNQA